MGLGAVGTGGLTSSIRLPNITPLILAYNLKMLSILFGGSQKGWVSKRVVLADVPPERKPERGYVRQNHPFTKPTFYLPVRT